MQRPHEIGDQNSTIPAAKPVVLVPEIMGRISALGQDPPKPIVESQSLGQKILMGAAILGSVLAVSFLVNALFGNGGPSPTRKTNS